MIDSSTPQRTARSAEALVPRVTALFWVVKVLTTGMGESFADFLDDRTDRDTALLVATIVLVIALIAQLATPRCRAWVYWFAVVMVGIWGTMAADTIDFRWKVPLPVSTLGFLLALAGLFAAWYRVEGTLAVHDITTARRQVWYWLAVIVTFMLGTAAGDLTASRMHLGYRWSLVLFAVLIALPAVARRWAGVNAIAAFWFAYVLTRPLGASIADWLGGDRFDGMHLGTGWVSLAAAVAIVALVAVLDRQDARRRAAAVAAA
ncbi:hypothetical protein [Nocardia sp. alder85J]|uniref:COG4705 family protein n=1 Tax=Nocardia sp. alder85J TaxID=2862949 RepID=UPI001CD1CDA2|nr:hypothetical protein [Nocardia sp. alder85J]MCX4098859.1 hypothetical protein [Nocardia sp. alder85J]